MELTGNTILITGGGSGIGRGLAEAFHARGNKVLVTGRNPDRLKDIEESNPGIRAFDLDVDDPLAIKDFAGRIAGEFPSLNVLVNNAGIMRAETIQAFDTVTAEASITTNFLGPIRLTAALLPHLLSMPRAAVLTVSSGLAFVPRAIAPTYCATKAAIHSYTQSLRVRLRGTPVQIIELVPPYVQTQLMSPQQATDPNAMPLADFIAESMALLEASPEAEEILVQRVGFQRWAEREGRYDAAFERANG